MVVVKPEPQDEDRAKPPPRAPKMLSSFFGEFLLPPLPWLCWQEVGRSFSRELQVHRPSRVRKPNGYIS